MEPDTGNSIKDPGSIKNPGSHIKDQDNLKDQRDTRIFSRLDDSFLPRMREQMPGHSPGQWAIGSRK